MKNGKRPPMKSHLRATLKQEPSCDALFNVKKQKGNGRDSKFQLQCLISIQTRASFTTKQKLAEPLKM